MKQTEFNLSRLRFRLAWAIRAPFVALRLASNRLWKWTGNIAREPVQLGGQTIWMSRGLTPAERAQAGRLIEALELLSRIQPSRHHRLMRLRIEYAIAPMASSAGYFAGTHIIGFDPACLAEDIGTLAGILVNQSSYAHQDRRGWLHPLLMERCNYLARLDQMAFALRLSRNGYKREAQRLLDLANWQPEVDNGIVSRGKRVLSADERAYRGR